MMMSGAFMNTARKFMFLMVIATIVMSVVIPVAYFVSVSFASNYEAYKFPAKIFPAFSYDAKLVYNAQDNNFSLQIKNNGTYESIKTDNDAARFQDYLMSQLNVKMDKAEIASLMQQAKAANAVDVTLKKDMFRNYAIFFILANGSGAALLNSLEAAGWTILISLVFGGTAGYAIARMDFKFKETINISLLLVKMFPIVAISLPMVIYLIKMNLYDTPLSLALVYSVPNIALTAWITGSIFKGISTELEEAAMIFGASKIKAFLHVTAPLAFPALVASSLYAFLAAWNDSITALIMTDENPTLALVVYRTVGSATLPNTPAAGAIILLIPSLVFTFIIKNYINQMWGHVKI